MRERSGTTAMLAPRRRPCWRGTWSCRVSTLTTALSRGTMARGPIRDGATAAPRVHPVVRVSIRAPVRRAREGACEMADDFVPGLEGVIAFETEIAEPDKDGGALRYRGVDIEDLVGKITFGNVWALLVDGKFGPGLPPAEPFPIPVHSGDVRVDVQAALAMLAPFWGYRPLLDIS